MLKNTCRLDKFWHNILVKINLFKEVFYEFLSIVFLFITTSSLALSAKSSNYQIPPSSTSSKIENKTNLLKKISSEISAISEEANRALVFVSVSKSVKTNFNDPLFEFFFGPRKPNQPLPKQKGLGSGFFIDLNKGYVLTNNHVIDGADEISLKLANDESYDAKVIGRDANTDVAVVQIKDKKFSRKSLSSLVLSDMGDVEVGGLVLAFGAPFSLKSSTTLGIVSAMHRGSLQITDLGNFLQTDAAINPGNSGGPLLGMDGRVVGINTAIASSTGAYNGVGFAIPADLVRDVATRLINHGKVERGYLGVAFSSSSQRMAGKSKASKRFVWCACNRS